MEFASIAGNPWAFEEVRDGEASARSDGSLSLILGREIGAAPTSQGGLACNVLDPCPSNPNGAKCIGSWDVPRDLDFPGFCNPRNGCNTCTGTIAFPPPVGNLDFGHDEIGHLSLIPRNDAYKGYVVIWTVCTANPGYVSHVFNPLLATSDPLIVHPAFVGAEEPFCSGHAWVFDEEKKPELLTVGGSDGFPAASQKVYSFDAATLSSRSSLRQARPWFRPGTTCCSWWM